MPCSMAASANWLPSASPAPISPVPPARRPAPPLAACCFFSAGSKRLKGIKDSKSRIIMLLTDGDNNKGEIDPVPAAQLAAALGAKVYTIGIGIEAPCQLPLFDPNTGKLELDANGNVQYRMVLQPANYSVLGKMA